MTNKTELQKRVQRSVIENVAETTDQFIHIVIVKKRVTFYAYASTHSH